jgi:hypothetical protein
VQVTTKVKLQQEEMLAEDEMEGSTFASTMQTDFRSSSFTTPTKLSTTGTTSNPFFLGTPDISDNASVNIKRTEVLDYSIVEVIFKLGNRTCGLKLFAEEHSLKVGLQFPILSDSNITTTEPLKKPLTLSEEAEKKRLMYQINGVKMPFVPFSESKILRTTDQG